MDPVTLSIVTLRFLASFAAQLGRPKDAAGLNDLAAVAQSGVNVDAHMRHVGDQLAAGNPIDWDDVQARYRRDSGRLQGKEPEPVKVNPATETQTIRS